MQVFAWSSHGFHPAVPAGTAGREISADSAVWDRLLGGLQSGGFAGSPYFCPNERFTVKSSVENIDPTRVKLSVEAPYAELKPSIDAAYKEIAKQVSIPGFRRGKVPARIIDQRVGRPAVLQEAVNNSLDDLYRKAIDEHELRPLGSPEVEVTAIPGLDGTEEGDLTFTIEVDVRPEITLPAYDSITVEVDHDATRALQGEWDRRGIPIPLKALDSPYREITRPVVDYVKSIRSGNPRDLVVVYIPQYVLGHWWEQALHNQSALRLRSRLLFTPGVMVSSVPWQLASSEGAEERMDGPVAGDVRRGGA